VAELRVAPRFRGPPGGEVLAPARTVWITVARRAVAAAGAAP
jgi:hypothetical protein